MNDTNAKVVRGNIHGSYTESYGLDVAIRAALSLRKRIGPFRLLFHGGEPPSSEHTAVLIRSSPE